MKPQVPGANRCSKTRDPIGVVWHAIFSRPLMTNHVVLLTEKIGHSLGEYARKAQHRLLLAAPFIKRKALECLLAEVQTSVALTVFTRWSVDEISAGVSDLSVFDLLHERGSSRL